MLQGFTDAEGNYIPGKPDLRGTEKILLAETLRDVWAFQAKPEIIASWQSSLRRVFEHYFKKGYAAVDFIFGDRCYYVLEKLGRNSLKNGD